MARDFAKAFYNSRAWQVCRKGYVKSKVGLCEDCLKRGIYTPGKVVHHVVHLTPANINDPSITLNWDNLRLVCQDCHAAEHAEEQRYRFDEQGNVISCGSDGPPIPSQ